MLKQIRNCRVCGSDKLTEVISLGDQYLQCAFLPPDRANAKVDRYPLRLMRCCPELDSNACGLVQLQHTVPPELLFSNYWYRSGVSNTMRNHLKQLAEEANQMFGDDIRVLDIGANDGTFLSYIKASTKLGIDPSDIPTVDDISVLKMPYVVTPGGNFSNFGDKGKFDLITTIACFYDMDDPVGFASTVKDDLKDGGVWCIEVAYLPDMIVNLAFDAICFEHLTYYTLYTLLHTLTKAGMSIFRAELNKCNGGSLRVYATRFEDMSKHSKYGWGREITKLIDKECDIIDDVKAYNSFADKVKNIRSKLQTMVQELLQQDKTIHILGASTKGNTLLQYCNFDYTTFPYAADRDPRKNGCSTVGTNIKIVSEEESRAMKPDVYFVLPWHFKTELVEREHEFLNRGGKLLFPLPRPELMSKAFNFDVARK